MDGRRVDVAHLGLREDSADLAQVDLLTFTRVQAVAMLEAHACGIGGIGVGSARQRKQYQVAIDLALQLHGQPIHRKIHPAHAPLLPDYIPGLMMLSMSRTNRLYSALRPACSATFSIALYVFLTSSS